jgi:MFS family permease
MTDDKADDLSPIAPLRQPIFRMLWLTWLMANLCMWMNDVAAAWMMASISTTAIWVALVQTAATLPMFVLGLPSGALADSLDRKRYFLVTQLWVAVVAVLLSLTILLGWVSPPLLLALVFANGIGLAMRWPVFAAIVPEIVSRPQLPAALALNGVSMNISRIVGPLVAGALIASVGTVWVFLLNAVLSVAAAIVIGRWQREHRVHPLGRERLGPAMRVGLQYVMQSHHLKGVLLRIFTFFFHSTAVMALLPLLAKGMQNGDASTFTALLACMGMGAITSAVFLPRLRKRYTRDGLVLRGTVVQALSMAAMSQADVLWTAAPAMFVGGAAWITTANTLSVSIQLGLPDWVRARGMSIYQMALMGGSAVGAAVWGQVATLTTVQHSLGTAAVMGAAAMWVISRQMPDAGLTDDLTPKPTVQTTSSVERPDRGRVMVLIEYSIDPVRSAEFRELMLGDGRRSRLRNGALSWELLHDIHQPERFIEVIVDESWTDHLRRFDRSTASDATLGDKRRSFQLGDEPLRVTKTIMETSAT